MDILEKIQLPESRKLEFKESLPKSKKIVQTIVSFANGVGGELLVGVADKSRQVVGVADPLALEEQLTSIIHDSITPPVSPFFTFINVSGKILLSVQVLAGGNKPYYVKSLGLEKGVFVRIGSSNRMAEPDVIKELQRQSRGLSYSAEIDFQHGLKVLQESVLDSFFSTLDQPGYNSDSLVKWRIAGRNNGDILPTVTGLVLFGENNVSGYDYAHIRVTRFLGITMGQVVESREYSLPLIDKIEQLCNAVTSFLRKESYFEGPRRLERTLIPYFAIREAVVNAIVHRDYSITGSSIKVNVFDDRFEIISPGILFGSFDIEDLGTGLSECRNRSIVRIFRQLGLMEELGTGIARINELCQEKGLQAPQYEEQAQFFRVTIWQKKIQEDLTGQIESKLMMRSMSAAELSDELNIHHNTALKHLKKLIAAGRAVKTGAGNRTKYGISL